MQWWIDESVANAQPDLIPNIHRQLRQHDSQLELVSDIHVIPGGEQIKNDPSQVEHIFSMIERFYLIFFHPF